MAGLPDTPKKAIDYVCIFLPGFAAMGLVVYITGVVLSEFTFAYSAIALSVFIYYAARAIEHRRASAFRRFLYGTVLVVLTLVIAVGIVLVYESQWIIRSVNQLAPSTVLTVSNRGVLQGLISADAARSTYLDIDDRHVDFRLEKKDVMVGGKPRPVKARYDLYMRVYVDDERIYEGRVGRFESEKGKEGMPFVLTPACRVTIDETTKAESFGRIYGPGVLITGKELKLIELYEHQASACWRCFNPGRHPKSPQCYDVVP